MMIYMKLLLAAALWGGSFVAGKIITGELGAYSAAFIRFAMASVVLVGLTISKEGRLPRLKGWPIIGMTVLGMTGVFSYNVCFFKGLQTIEASRASIIIANNPVFIALLSCVFFREQLGIRKLAGIALSVIGAIVVISKGDIPAILQEGIGKGELLIFCCVMSWVTYSLVGKVLMKDYSPLVLVTYSSVIGTAALAVPAYLEGGLTATANVSAAGWGWLVYLALGATVVAFVWFYEGVRHIGPTRAGLFINFVPIFAIVISYFVLNEAITVSLLAGLLLVSAGVYLTNKKQSTGS